MIEVGIIIIAVVNPLSSMLWWLPNIQKNAIEKNIIKLMTKLKYNFDLIEFGDLVILLVIKIEMTKPIINKNKCKNIVNVDEVIEYKIKAKKNIIPKIPQVISVLFILIDTSENKFLNLSSIFRFSSAPISIIKIQN